MTALGEVVPTDEAKIVAAAIVSRLTGAKNGFNVLLRSGANVITIEHEGLGGISFSCRTAHADKVRVMRTATADVYRIEFYKAGTVLTRYDVPGKEIQATVEDYTGLSFRVLVKRSDEEMSDTAKAALAWFEAHGMTDHWFEEFTKDFAVDFIATEKADPMFLGTEVVLVDGSHLSYTPPVGWSYRGIWKEGK